MSLSAGSLADQIPYYLTQEEKTGLVEALKNWPKKIAYYANCWPNDMLQGDAWTRLPVRRFETGEAGFIDGIVLSNSCSIDPANPRDLPAKVTIAPLMSLENYLGLLKSTGISADQMDSKLLAIREQRIHNVFFLPAGSGLKSDSVALLDDLYTFPSSALAIGDDGANRKLVTLSMVGFYLFVFKLSVHFCRFHENVARNDAV